MEDFSHLYPNTTTTICEAMHVPAIVAHDNQTDDSCVVVIDDKVFVNTLSVGLSIAVANLIAGLVINMVGKKPILSESYFVALLCDKKYLL